MSMLSIQHLFGLENISKKDINIILDTAFKFREVLDRPIKRVPSLKGKNILNLFFENSTRTKISFELAAKRLSADVTSFSPSTSSLKKGESFKDTIQNLHRSGYVDYVGDYKNFNPEYLKKCLKEKILINELGGIEDLIVDGFGLERVVKSMIEYRV